MAVFSDPIFNEPDKYNTGALWLAVIAYSLRIYCDFSGYSDMASAWRDMFGYKLTRNFNMPYLAANVTDFCGAGTSRCRPGCGTIFSSRWAAAGGVPG